MLTWIRADDTLFSPEEEASLNVDALVNDTDNDSARAATPLANPILDQSRRATPTIPPGFSAAALAKPFVVQPAPPLSRNASFNVTPAVPVVPVTPIRPVTPAKAKEKTRVEPAANPDNDTERRPAATEPTTPANKSREAKLPKTQASESSKKRPKESKQLTTPEHKAIKTPEPTPSIKATPKSRPSGKSAQSAIATASPQQAAKENVTQPTPSSTLSTKRQHPGKLDIAAATKLSDMGDPSKVDAQPKNIRNVSMASAVSVPSSPAATSTGSPVKRATVPRTLRVLPTPKTELPPPLSAVSTTVPQIPTVDKLRSRQASIASINLPGTPVSELVSDNASVTSTSLSRPSSPPLIGGKVGSAPVRKKTKSQAKKDRQERARQIVEEQATAMDEQTKSDPEPVQAPIVGRKKKAKKPGSTIPKPISIPAKSQPASPKPAIVEEEETEEDKVITTPITATKKGHSAKTSISSPHQPQFSPEAEHDVFKDKKDPTAQSIIAELQRTGELLASTLEFFKPLSSSLAHAARGTQPLNTSTPPDLKIHFSEADLDALAKKKPVRLHGQNGKSDSRTLITPQGKFFWGLTQELEEKALELEKHIEELKGSARFRPRKQHAHSHHHSPATAQSKDVLPAIATALKEAGAKLSKSGAGSSSGQQMPALDPTSTLLGSTPLPLPPVHAPTDTPPHQQQQAPADATAYLNQFVLPNTDNPSSNTPRTEMAAVGGPPGVGSVNNMSVNVNKIAKAAKVVAEGGTWAGAADVEGLGVMAADFLGGVVVQGLEALVGAGLGFDSSMKGGEGGIGIGVDGLAGVDVQGLVDVLGVAGGLGGLGGPVGRGARGSARRSVLSVDEAEQAMLQAKKENEVLEKKLAAVMKRNKKVVGGGKA
ncbi:hypothetical protein K491DRAFT_35883 [Lophiostoma macrostomum CBS 122681]|uniref:Uncharacterized protein n=1 Tax=Lophiostoma macrostomum CBS 122681 TaxID=1314788 RepID=A0A6A6SYC5_9PLEO|nr:hypothetical protein K491DRAFT_35883 [Lophiostoma macrostomum CBS 122681]